MSQPRSSWSQGSYEQYVLALQQTSRLPESRTSTHSATGNDPQSYQPNRVDTITAKLKMASLDSDELEDMKQNAEVIYQPGPYPTTLSTQHESLDCSESASPVEHTELISTASMEETRATNPGESGTKSQEKHIGQCQSCSGKNRSTGAWKREKNTGSGGERKFDEQDKDDSGDQAEEVEEGDKDQPPKRSRSSLEAVAIGIRELARPYLQAEEAPRAS
ncbi:hypothetical protein FKW77_009283 [Venturia effusa]|uniref:Uncharacterized protein n=1 Tax=Venturia effusa TaxID=50376 RepID=A0A517KX84_9PEZI|nr:hypothetical protein FKW77_009283 [Venturia effusa]